MTDQLDWAEEIADKFVREGRERPVWAGEIGAAIRSACKRAFKRGEASGMRMAADVVLTAPYLSIAGSNMVAESIRTQADQIEKGL